MPLYEYVCRRCGHHFEALVQSGNTPASPACQSPHPEQQFSVFAVGGRTTMLAADQPPGPCSTCGDPRGPGACSLK